MRYTTSKSHRKRKIKIENINKCSIGASYSSMNFQAYSRLSPDQMIYAVHLSEIHCKAGSAEYCINAYWHPHTKQIILGYNTQFYVFTLSGVKNQDLTVRQILYAIGFNHQTIMDIRLPSYRAYEWSREDILDGDFCSIIPHQIYVELPYKKENTPIVS